MSGEQKVTYASRSQLTMKMNGDTYQYRFVIGDFTGDFTDEEKKILHIYVMYMVQTAIKMHQMANRIRLTQPDENEWWMNVECTSMGCTDKTEVLKELRTKTNIKICQDKATSVFADMKSTGKNKTLDEVIRPGYSETLIDLWLRQLEALFKMETGMLDPNPTDTAMEADFTAEAMIKECMDDRWLADTAMEAVAVEAVELVEEEVEEEVAVSSAATTPDQIANLVHQFEKLPISNTVTSDQHANQIQALRTRIEKRRGTSL